MSDIITVLYGTRKLRPAGSPFAKRLSTRTTLSKKKHEEQPWRTKRTSPTYARRGRRSWASWDVPRPLYLRVSCHRCAHRAGFGVTGHGSAFPSNDGRSGQVLSTDSSRRKCTDSYVETSFGKQTVSWREYRSRSIGRALPQFPAHEEQSQWWIGLSCGIFLSFQLSK